MKPILDQMIAERETEKQNLKLCEEAVTILQKENARLKAEVVGWKEEGLRQTRRGDQAHVEVEQLKERIAELEKPGRVLTDDEVIAKWTNIVQVNPVLDAEGIVSLARWAIAESRPAGRSK